MTKFKYPTHEEIYEMMEKLFKANVNFNGMHNRESLDDLISDLKQYRKTLPSIKKYLAANEL